MSLTCFFILILLMYLQIRNSLKIFFNQPCFMVPSQVKGVLDRCIDRVESDLRKAAAEKAKKMLPPKSKEERDREAVRDDLYKPARTSLTFCAFSACLSPPLSLYLFGGIL